MKILILNLLVFILLYFNLYAQGTQAFDFVYLPHSISSFGTGWQGVASLTNDDALIYNPAKLNLTDKYKLSFYRNPFQMIGAGPLPLTDFTFYYNIDSINSFGISYNNWDFGETLITTADDPVGTEKVYIYQRSFSAGYARRLGSNISAGIQLRYAYWNGPKITPSGFFISLGLLYNPELWNRRLNLGFSIMNLGPAVKFESFAEENYESYDPPPTQLNVGAYFITAENNYFSLPISLSISKPFDKRDSKGNGESSFKTIFTDWSDFPNDAALHAGLSFIWKPLNLGNGFSYIQDIFIGNYSSGNKTGLQNYYTHGADIGINYKGISFKMGYAGVSHNVHSLNYFKWTFPYETFQFTIELNDNLFNRNKMEETDSKPQSVIFSLGLGRVTRLGIAKSYTIENYTYSADDNYSYSLESSFYFNNNNALVAAIVYNSLLTHYSYLSANLLNVKIETFTFFSSYRYHFLEQFHPVFIQAGLGIFRLNPVILSSPRYDYKTALQFSTGLTLDYLDPFVIMPVIDYNFIIYPAVSGDAPRIQGYNQLNFILKLGYKLSL